MALTRFSPEALPTIREFATRAVSATFSEQTAAAMHTRLVQSLSPDAFTSLYEDLAQAEVVDDLSSTSRLILRQALSEIEQAKGTWTPEQEQLHPRGQGGRFASKPGGGGIAGAVEGAVGDLEQAVKGLMDAAKQHEAEITNALKDVVAKHGGKMEGLANKLKTQESIHSKVQRDVDDMPGLDAPTAARNISDALRYTAIFGHDDHVGGVQAVIQTLEQHGFQVHKLKNFWQPGDAYNGINGQFVHPDTGFRFELQFHTSDSFTKKQQIHLLYEHFRDSKDAHERRMLWNQMVKASDALQTPPGILEVGQLVQQQGPA